MKRKLSIKNNPFIIFIILVIFCSWTFIADASDSKQSSVTLSSSVDSNSQSELTEELWTLVRSLRQLRTDYYEKQSQNADKIQQLRNTSEKLQAEVEELRRLENQIDKNLSEIESDIQKLKIENEKNELAESSASKQIDQFVAKQTAEIEKGIPYRKFDRLTRLQGNAQTEQLQEEHSFAQLFARVWNFSQEEMRIARSGETFTEMVELTDDRLQHARLFRVGHQVLGYLTEQGDRAGIWVDGAGWKKAKKSEAESVKEAVEILDQKRAPRYVQLPVKPVKAEPVDLKSGTTGINDE